MQKLTNGVNMTSQYKLDALQLAKNLTGSTNIKELIAAAQELENYLTLNTATRIPARFADFLKVLTILDPFVGRTSFEPYPFQIDLADRLQDPNSQRIIINSARQMGITTLVAAFALHECAMKPNQTILIAAFRFVSALEVMDKIHAMYENMDSVARPPVTEYNKGSIKFGNGSSIIARAAGSMMGRGMSLTHAIIDNAAFIPFSKEDELYSGLAPCLIRGGKLILTGCPSSSKGKFAEFWREDNGWEKISLPWHLHPDHGNNWEKAMRLTIGDNAFDREYGLQFIDRPEPNV